MLKRITALILSLAAFICISSCAGGREAGVKSDKISVLVTFNAMEEFVKAVGGNRVEVKRIIPDGMEPHDFEPKARDLIGLSSARVFVYNGLGMEAWAEDAVRAAGNDDLIAVEASRGIEAIKNSDAGQSGQYDPHVWLSLICAQTEAENIKDALAEADPAGRDYYEANYGQFVSSLDKLYNEYAEKFSAVQKRSFVTGHAAFAYLCRDFGLEQNSVEDVFAGGEPGARQLTSLIEYCRENNVTTIFAEEMASPEVSRTLADEVGAGLVTIYTIAGSEDGKTYLERMEENLGRIYESLAV
ncbi:MAG: metal ABC transporter substrate-binding protein [Oscillospiraceae bacterium]|jgi:zinc transport system substrate-binding protein